MDIQVDIARQRTALNAIVEFAMREGSDAKQATLLGQPAFLVREREATSLSLRVYIGADQFDEWFDLDDEGGAEVRSFVAGALASIVARRLREDIETSIKG